MKRLQDKYNEMSLQQLDKYDITKWNGRLGNHIHFLEQHVADMETYILQLETNVRELKDMTLATMRYQKLNV